MTNGEIPRQVVADAGPLIAFFNEHDPEYEAALRGMRQLAEIRARLIVPLPVLCEVVKWLRYHVGATHARQALERLMLSTIVQYPDAQSVDLAVAIILSRASWNGSLEDALVVVVARTENAPIWTLDYRDLGTFSDLHFWAPGA